MEKENEPLVSVLMTAYNRDKFIGAAIESVLASTYRNFELIIVDDCSLDRTVDVSRSYEARDSRVKVYVNKKNLGDYPNRNEAARLAQGKYLKYLDSDDLIYPHGLAVFVSSMEKFPGAGLCVCYNGLQMKDPFPVPVPRTEVLRSHFFNSGILNIGPSGTIISKDAFQHVGGFSGKRMVGDTELWFAIACRYDVVVAQPSLIYWRQHEGQEFFEGVKSGLYTEMTFDLIKDLLSDKECTLSIDEKVALLKRYKNATSLQLIKSLIRTRNVTRFLALHKRFDLGSSDYFNSVLGRFRSNFKVGP